MIWWCWLHISMLICLELFKWLHAWYTRWEGTLNISLYTHISNGLTIFCNVAIIVQVYEAYTAIGNISAHSNFNLMFWDITETFFYLVVAFHAMVLIRQYYIYLSFLFYYLHSHVFHFHSTLCLIVFHSTLCLIVLFLTTFILDLLATLHQ